MSANLLDLCASRPTSIPKMDYTPKHAQPFTLNEVRELDIPEITKGVAYILSIASPNVIGIAQRSRVWKTRYFI